MIGPNLGYWRTSAGVYTDISNRIADIYPTEANVTKDGSNNVSNVADISPDSNAISQDTGANQPLWVDSVINGLPVLRFSGSSRYMKFSVPLLSSTACTVFVVIKFDSVGGTAGPQGILSNASFQNNEGLYFRMSSGEQIGAGLYVNGGSSFVNGALWGSPNTNFNLIDFWIDNDDELFVNGSSQGSGSISTGIPTSAVDMYVGARADIQDYFDGDLARIIVYDRKLDASERSLVRSYLNNLYNL